MSIARTAKISLVIGLVETHSLPFYEVLLDDGTQFSLSGSTSIRPRSGDILTWYADGNQCREVHMNGRSLESSEAALDRARKILAAKPSFGEWLLIERQFHSLDILLLKQEILSGIATQLLEPAYILEHRIPEPLIDSLVEVRGELPKHATTIMWAWSLYLRDLSIEHDGEVW